MYVPKQFAVQEPGVLFDLIEAHSFGILVAGGGDDLAATHLPFLVERNRGGNATLLCHMARANPHWRALDNRPALAIFVGPHAYVSPIWYEEPRAAVPTWNYAAVHAHGTARLVTDAARLGDIVTRLAGVHEAGRSPEWSPTMISSALLGGMLKAIVGVEIAVERLKGVHKLSQNRSAIDRRQVIAALRGSGEPSDRALADYMHKHACPPE